MKKRKKELLCKIMLFVPFKTRNFLHSISLISSDHKHKPQNYIRVAYAFAYSTKQNTQISTWVSTTNNEMLTNYKDFDFFFIRFWLVKLTDPTVWSKNCDYKMWSEWHKIKVEKKN